MNALDDRRGLLDALDLPPELQTIQNIYWQKKREFLALEDAVLHVFVAFLDLAQQQDADVPSAP